MAEGHQEPSSPKVLDRDGVLSVLGYKGEVKQFSEPIRYLPEDLDICYKCGKKVYPVERIDVGALYHRSCFKCRVCNSQLSLRNFQRGVDFHTNTKEVFCNTHVPRHTAALHDMDAIEIKAALAAQKAANLKGERVGVGEYGEGALEFERLRREKPGQRPEDGKRKKVRRSSTLRSFQDFERYGIFDAQATLEKVHKQEEDELYQQMADDRRDQMEGLRHFVQSERQKTVEELVYWFRKRGSSQQDIAEGLKKVEYYYNRQLEERIKLLENRLIAEERAAVARMGEKHATEMIALIAEKESQAEKDMRRHQDKLRSQLDAHDVAAAKIQGNVKDKQGQLQSHLDDQIKGKLGQTGSQEGQMSQQGQRPVTIQATFGDGAKGHAATEQGQGPLVEAGGPSTHVFNQVEHFSGDHRVVAAGGWDGTFKPITPVLETVKLTPDFVSWRETNQPQSTVRVELEGGCSTAEHSVDYSDDLLSQSEEEEDDDVGTEASYRVEDIETALEEKQAAQKKPTTRDQFGQPFIQLEQPGSKPPQRGTPHPGSANSQHPGSVSQGPARHPGPASQGGSQPHPGLKGYYYEDDEEEEDEEDEEVFHVPHTVTSGKHKGKARPEEDPEDESAARRRRRERRVQKKKFYEEITKPIEVDEAAERDNAINEKIQTAELAQPRVVPPRDTKAQLYTDPAVFQQFDQNALKEAQKEHTSYTELVRQLSVNCRNELQKVRAIFIWITAKDLNAMRFDKVDPDSPLGLLRGIKHGIESYHNLFKRLCSYAGLHCEIIEGYSKGSGYKPGTSFKSGEVFRNQWTAVWVKRAWRFINCNWGARHVKGPGEERMTYKVDEFYFLTDPHEHIYQHFPHNPKWQLLQHTIPIEEFVRLPVVKSPFFNRHLAFAKDYSSVLTVEEGLCEIHLVCPQKLYNFSAKLVSKDRSTSTEVLQDKLLIRMVENDVIFGVNLPVPGKYYLDIYVAKSHASESMDHACGFMLNALTASKYAQLNYPQLGPFGRLPYFTRMGLTEQTHTDSLIIAHGGEFVVAFTSSKPVRVSHVLQYYHQKERNFTDCERYAFPKHRGDTLSSFVVKCPKRGLYMFTFNAEIVSGGSGSRSNSPSRASQAESKNTSHTVYRYLIECQTPVAKIQSFPRASKRWQHCKLLQPLSGDLPMNARVTFKIESTVAKGMVVVIDENWHYMELDGDLWQATVDTGFKPGKAMVYGRIDTSRDKYIPCLEYSIIDPHA